MKIYFMLGEVIHVLEQWFPTFFIPISFDKRRLLISSLLLTYVGYTGTLMVETDLIKVINSTFSGFPKMLCRRIFPRMYEV